MSFEFDMDKIILSEFGPWDDRIIPTPVTGSDYKFKVADYDEGGFDEDPNMFVVYVSDDEDDSIGSHIPEVDGIMMLLGISSEEMEGIFGGVRLGKTNEDISKMLTAYGWTEDATLCES